MTVAELAELLQHEEPGTKLFVCHWARRAGTNIPIIFPLAAIKWQGDLLVLVEADDRHLYLASI